MENYIIYEEIGKGDACTVYKGRRKGTINFVSVLSVEKTRRAAITNWVRIAHQISDDHVVRFLEWYETSNHLWLVLELCTGGSLEQVISQDERLPIAEIRKMGGDLCRGIYALQKHEICIGDLSPSRCLLDGPGILKINNLSCAHFENEEIESVYQSVMEEMNSGIEQDSLDEPLSAPFSNPIRSIRHHSPEALIGHVTLQSDIWSLGAVLYEMYNGTCPYEGNEIDDVLMAMQKESPSTILSKMVINDENTNEMEFMHFRDLLEKLLVKDPEKRPTIEQVFKHKFWHGKLKLDDEGLSNKPNERNILSTISGKEPTMRSVDTGNSIDTNKTLTNSMLCDRSVKLDESHSIKSSDNVLKRQKTELLRSLNSRRASRTQMSAGLESTLSIKDSSSLPQQSLTRMSIFDDSQSAEHSTQENPIIEAKSAGKFDVPNKQRTFSASVPKTPESECDPGEDYNAATLLVHRSEHPNIEAFLQRNRKDTLTKYEMRNLPQSLTGKDIENIDEDHVWRSLFSEMQKILTEQNNKVQIGCLGWICAEISKVPEFSRQLWLQTSFVSFCCKSVRSSNEHRGRYARLLSTAALVAEKRIDFDNGTIEKNFRDVLLALSDSLREQFSRQGKQKLQVLPALGQLLIIAARHDDQDGGDFANRPKSSRADQGTSVLCPPPCYSLVIRCLSPGEEIQVQSVAAQIIEIHSFISARSRFSHSGIEAGLALWSMASRAGSDGVKSVALSALAQVCYRSPQQAVSIMEKVGLPKIFDFLFAAPHKSQPFLLTIIGVVFLPNIRSSTRAMANRICQHRDIHQKIIRLADSPLSLVRSKAFLCMELILQQQPDFLLSYCKLKFVALVEREWKRLGVTDLQQTTKRTYPFLCLKLLIDHANRLVPHIVYTSYDALNETCHRKHPTTGQLKILKEKLPELSVLPHLMSSSVFRPNLLTEEFLEGVSSLAVLCAAENRIGAVLGEELWNGLLDSIVSVIEVACARPEIISSYAEHLCPAAFPLLTMLLVGKSNSGSRLLYVKLLTDLLGVLLDTAEHDSNKVDMKMNIPDDRRVRLIDEIPQLLLSEPPLPVFTLRLLYQLLACWSDEFAELLPKSGVLEVLITFVEMQCTEQTNTSVQKQLFPLLRLIWEKVSIESISILLENDFIEHFMHYISHQKHNDYEILTTIFTLTNRIVQTVSEVVKTALKAKSKNAPAQVVAESSKTADYLLRKCGGIIPIISFLLSHCEQVNPIEQIDDENGENSELLNLCCSTVSLFIHLWGGEGCHVIFEQDKLTRLGHLLTICNMRNQRLILKSIRKGVQIHLCASQLESHSSLIAQIKTISTQTAIGDTKDLQTIASEILHHLG